MRAGKGCLQPDKAASFGAELMTLYEMTGDARFLKAATAIAETLTLKGNPIDTLVPLAAARIPLIHVVGDSEDGVPIGGEHYGPGNTIPCAGWNHRGHPQTGSGPTSKRIG